MEGVLDESHPGSLRNSSSAVSSLHTQGEITWWGRTEASVYPLQSFTECGPWARHLRFKDERGKLPVHKVLSVHKLPGGKRRWEGARWQVRGAFRERGVWRSGSVLSAKGQCDRWKCMGRKACAQRAPGKVRSLLALEEQVGIGRSEGSRGDMSVTQWPGDNDNRTHCNWREWF